MKKQDFRLLKLSDVRRMTGLSRSTIYNLIQKGEMPVPMKLSERTSRWREDVILEWIDEKAAEAEEARSEKKEDSDMTQTQSCEVCEGDIDVQPGGWDGGHNANPVVDGRCCSSCNWMIVVPARVGVFNSRDELELAILAKKGGKLGEEAGKNGSDVVKKIHSFEQMFNHIRAQEAANGGG